MSVQHQLGLWSGEIPGPALLTVKEAGRILAVSRSTAYELIAAGQLETVHIGRSVRIPVDAIVAYVKSLRRPDR
jgi:excisionase family DNA binding protein